MPGRMLASAALVSSIGAGVLATLALYLNPSLRLRDEASALLVCLFLPWAAVGWLGLALLAAAGSTLRWWRPGTPVIPGRPYFAPFAFVTLAVLAGLYWSNLLAYRHALPIETLRALALSAVVVSGAVAVFVAIGLDLWLYPERNRSLAGVLAILAPAAALAVPLALRPEPAPAPRPAPVPVRLDAAQPSRRVFVVGIDGLGVGDLVGEPIAPVLARLARRGALGALATLRPTESPPLWTTLMTGRFPRDHGVLSASVYALRGSGSEWSLLPKGAGIGVIERSGLVTRRPIASTVRRHRALWNVLDAFGAPSGLVRIWGTQPPEAIHGFVVSPYFHLLGREPEKAGAALHPRDLLNEVAARVVRPADLDPALLAGLVDAPRSGSPLDDPRLLALAESALAPDLSYRRVAEVLVAAYRPALFVIDFHGFDAVGHSFYREAHPEAFGNVPPRDARRYGHVLERYASLLGLFVSELEKDMEPGDLLLVVSSHGLQPTPLWRRLVGVLSGTAVAAASHAAAPPGLLLAFGEGIQPGATLANASILDVAPTLLYLLGLPVPRDMEGRVLTEMLEPAYAREHPVTYIPSYEGLAVAPAVLAAPVDELPPLPDERP